ncbi:MAG TPA: hypothetical protein PL143_07935 [Rhodocyclaceae bacterium]|nr:hypothetical protein [Rhodocyclaceae bacterium]
MHQNDANSFLARIALVHAAESLKKTHLKMACMGTKVVQTRKKSAKIRRFLVETRDFGSSTARRRKPSHHALQVP